MKRNNISIKWKIFLYMLLFVVILLVVLWLFQTVFLDSFYKRIKIGQIERMANSLSLQIDNEDFESKMLDVARNNSICALVMTKEGEVIYSAEGLFECVIHSRRISQIGLINLMSMADENMGSYLERLELVSLPNMFRFENENYTGNRMPPTISNTHSMIYVKKVTTKDAQDVYIILNSNIAPVEATVETLRIQLFYITLILIVLALLLAIFISRKISKPIMKTNESAKKLAKGDYEVKFDSQGYKEIRELNDTLNTAAYELSRVESLRRELIANVSHDLRTPLTMITGFAEVIRDLPGENTPENAQVIVDEANRLSRLVSELLDLSKLQAGATSMTESKFDLTETIEKIVSRIIQLLGDERIKFAWTDQVSIEADETQVTQVVYNLITNAVTYSEKDVIVRQLTSKDVVRIEVEDFGPGIAADDLPYVWERYYKVDKIHKRASLGSGLGLSIVKEVMTKHKGRYGVASKEGSGSTFWVEFSLKNND